MKVINKDFAFLCKEYVDDATQEVAELLAFKVPNSEQFFTLEDSYVGSAMYVSEEHSLCDKVSIYFWFQLTRSGVIRDCWLPGDL